MAPAPSSTMSLLSPRAKEVAMGTPQEMDSMAVNGKRSVREATSSMSAALYSAAMSACSKRSVMILTLSSRPLFFTISLSTGSWGPVPFRIRRQSGSPTRRKDMALTIMSIPLFACIRPMDRRTFWPSSTPNRARESSLFRGR